MVSHLARLRRAAPGVSDESFPRLESTRSRRRPNTIIQTITLPLEWKAAGHPETRRRLRFCSRQRDRAHWQGEISRTRYVISRVQAREITPGRISSSLVIPNDVSRLNKPRRGCRTQFSNNTRGICISREKCWSSCVSAENFAASRLCRLIQLVTSIPGTRVSRLPLASVRVSPGYLQVVIYC